MTLDELIDLLEDNPDNMYNINSLINTINSIKHLYVEGIYCSNLAKRYYIGIVSEIGVPYDFINLYYCYVNIEGYGVDIIMPTSIYLNSKTQKNKRIYFNKEELI